MEIYTSKISVKEIVKALDTCFSVKTAVPVFIGESGIGKTQQIRKYAAMKNMGLVELNCSSLFVEDFGAIRDSEDFVEFKLNRIFDIDSPTLFFIDEFSRSRGDLRNIIMSLVNERKIYGTKISDHIKFAMAMNPATDDYGDTEDPFVDMATTRRFVVFEVISKVADWIKWATKNKINKNIISFISKNQIALISGQACPRQWVTASKILDKNGIEGIKLVAEGELGPVARPFIEHISGIRTITADDVLNNYKEVRDEIKKDSQLQLAIGIELGAKKLKPIHKSSLTLFFNDLNKEIKYHTIMELIEQKKGKERKFIFDIIENNEKLSKFMEEQSDY